MFENKKISKNIDLIFDSCYKILKNINLIFKHKNISVILGTVKILKEHEFNYFESRKNMTFNSLQAKLDLKNMNLLFLTSNKSSNNTSPIFCKIRKCKK